MLKNELEIANKVYRMKLRKSFQYLASFSEKPIYRAIRQKSASSILHFLRLATLLKNHTAFQIRIRRFLKNHHYQRSRLKDAAN
jgi:hypothetical protein